ncbi:hypothetical protein PXK56_17835 [Phaeobacter gallaeciensis]|uniref:hypothetical protein n=1 Tax=Phaeobacter gallaeciensis TaxID=60890 RepID=UPI002380BB90|nr:hypothetical protein [Phaeobacter gallaeciensis]MDE4297050.1 hypothetical protein [Phaeobacter gallaeciensis]
MTTTADPAVESPGYSVKDFIDAAQLKKDMSFSPNDIDTAMMEQASMFTHYGMLHADAMRQVDTIKLLLENTEAAVYKLIRDKMVEDGDKFTEALLEKSVARHTRVIQMKKALNQAKRIESIGKIAVEGFRHRRDMLIQQGVKMREEMKGELRVAERNAHADAMDAQKQSVLDRVATRNAA